jgi:hypothetical protein
MAVYAKTSLLRIGLGSRLPKITADTRWKWLRSFSHQLRTAEDRIAELEAEAESYREKAERAEQWLHKVYAEMEDRFLRQSEDRRRTNGVPTRATGHQAPLSI